MIRAVQTAELISEYLPNVPVKSTDILCEGAPIKPEPEVTHWKPEYWVGNIYLVTHKAMMKCLLIVTHERHLLLVTYIYIYSSSIKMVLV